jgi:signal transduction histidine kinase
MAVSILAPSLAVAGWLASVSMNSERRQAELSLQHRVNEIATVLDREVVGAQGVLTALAIAGPLQDRNLREFHEKAVEISRQLGVQVVLYGLKDNVQIMNTGVPFGASLENGFVVSKKQHDALSSGQGPFVSNLYYGPLIKQFSVAVAIRVMLGDEPVILAVVLRAAAIAKALQLVPLQPGYVANIIDSNGFIIARSVRHDEFVGTAAQPPVPDIPAGRAGMYPGASQENVQYRWFHQRTQNTPWQVVIGAPEETFNAGFRSALKTFTLASLGLLGVGLVIANRVSGYFSRDVSRLHAMTRHLPGLPSAGLAPSPLRETNELLDALQQASVQLHASDAQQRFAIEAAGIGTWSWDVTRTKFVWSPQTCELYEIPADVEPTARLFFTLVHPADVAGIKKRLQECMLRLDKWNMEYRVIGAVTGTTRWLSGCGRVERDKKGEAIFIYGTLEDITARKEAEFDRDDLRIRLMNYQESERSRLARELHDQTGQILTASLLEVGQIGKLMEGAGKPHLNRLRGHLEDIGKAVHRIAHELRPTAIEDLGLREAVADLVSDWSQQYSVPVDFHCKVTNLDTICNERKTTVYRVAQEALTNIAKHAKGVTAVSVIVDRAEDLLRLTVEDNGGGFDVSAKQRGARFGGLGLAGMSDRASLAGGTFEVESSMGIGTTVFLRIPFETEGTI